MKYKVVVKFPVRNVHNFINYIKKNNNQSSIYYYLATK